MTRQPMITSKQTINHHLLLFDCATAKLHAMLFMRNAVYAFQISYSAMSCPSPVVIEVRQVSLFTFSPSWPSSSVILLHTKSAGYPDAVLSAPCCDFRSWPAFGYTVEYQAQAVGVCCTSGIHIYQNVEAHVCCARVYTYLSSASQTSYEYK